MKLLALSAFLFLSIAGIIYLLKNFYLVNKLIQIKPNTKSTIDFISMILLGGISFVIIFLINLYFKLIGVLSYNELSVMLFRMPKEFIIAFGEEVFIRVFVFIGILIFFNNKYFALVISALIFSVLHSSESVLSLTSYFVAGIMYGAAFLRCENLWAPVGLHFGWNYFQGTIFGFPVSGQSDNGYLILNITESKILNGGVFGPEVSIIGIFMRLIILAAIIFFTRNRIKNSSFLRIHIL